MEIEEQKDLMNKMLKYLGKTSFSLKWDNGSRTHTTLTYNSEDSILRKKVFEYDFFGKCKTCDEREKAFGGTNGNDMFKAIKKATLEKAQRKVIREAMARELNGHDIFL